MIVSSKGKHLGLAGVALAISALSGSAQAGVVVAKPAPHGSGSFFAPEFSTSLARAGSFTLVGALQEHVPIAGEPAPTFPSIKQGAVYLMRGTNASPERVYQFPARRGRAARLQRRKCRHSRRHDRQREAPTTALK